MKVYDRYLILKEYDSSSFYLFKIGIFYVFLGSDAVYISDRLGLKLTDFNGVVQKCGFPVNAFTKYSKYLDAYEIKYKIVEDDITNDKVLNYLKEIDINKLTPIEALNILNDIKKELYHE